MKRKLRLPACDSSSTSVPRMSEGIRSGVNWMRRASSPSTVPMVSTSLVLARPGTPTRSAWPPERIVISARSTTRLLPEDDGADRGLGGARVHRRGFGGPHHHVLELFEPFDRHLNLLLFCVFFCLFLLRYRLRPSSTRAVARELCKHHASTVARRETDSHIPLESTLFWAPCDSCSTHHVHASRAAGACYPGAAAWPNHGRDQGLGHSPNARTEPEFRPGNARRCGKKSGDRRARRRCTCGIRRSAAISTCASRPTAPGST